MSGGGARNPRDAVALGTPFWFGSSSPRGAGSHPRPSGGPSRRGTRVIELCALLPFRRARPTVRSIQTVSSRGFTSSDRTDRPRYMAIQPHCVVCGSHALPIDDVKFVDFSPAWGAPRSADGSLIVGWSNELGVTAPPGVGLFCARHIRPARRLKHLTAAGAARRLQERDGTSWMDRMSSLLQRRRNR